MTDETSHNIVLNSFYIFNPTFCSLEGEEEKKLMFYHPHDTELNLKIRNIGFSEAAATFLKSLDDDDSVQSIRTDKCKHYFLEAEENYWMVMVVDIPISENDIIMIQDKVFRSALKEAYQMSKLFLGRFSDLLKAYNNNLTMVKRRTTEFFNKYVAEMNILSWDVVSSFRGVQYLPLNRKIGLSMQCFVNRFEIDFNETVSYTMLLHSHFLVWSGLHMSETRIVYKYLTSNLLNQFLCEVPSTTHNIIPPLNIHCKFGKYIVCPRHYYDIQYSEKIIDVAKLEVGFPPRFYQLIVYAAMSSFFCIFVKDSIELNVDYLKFMECYLKSKFLPIAYEMLAFTDRSLSKTCNCGTDANNEQTSQYVYFNHVNYAQKNSFRKVTQFNAVLDQNSQKALNTISFLTEVSDYSARELSEIVCETEDGLWVSKNSSNHRDFYVISNNKDCELVSIEGDVNRTIKSELKGVHF